MKNVFYLLITAGLTICLEYPVFCWGLGRMRETNVRLLRINVILVNLITNLALNGFSYFLFLIRGQGLTPLSGWSLVLEFLVVLIETALFYYAANPYVTAKSRARKLCKLLRVCFLANAFSYTVGLLVWR